jgi:hypothetical protein
MKTNGKREVIARIIRQSLVLAALLATLLSTARISRAQSSATSPTTPTARIAAASTEKPIPPAAKGQLEGITVHGHWTIDVKNPDGKLVSHREFENSLAPSNGGASLLAALLGRVVTPGSWWVLLTDTTKKNVIDISEPNSPASADCAVIPTQSTTGSCSLSLSVAGPSVSPGTLTGTTLTFTGSGTVPAGFPSTISYVETDNFPCGPSLSPSTCLTGTVPNIEGIFALTSRNLDGLSGDPAAVPVTPMQTVSVTVVISFQ